MTTPYVEYDHTDTGYPRYTLYNLERADRAQTIVRTPVHVQKLWAEDLLKWFDGIDYATPIHIGQHVTAETVGDIVERVTEIGRDR